MNVQKLTMQAVLAANAVEAAVGADPATRYLCLRQLQRHVDGLVEKERDKSRPSNPVSQNTGD
jgi:hypothetical protein